MKILTLALFAALLTTTVACGKKKSSRSKNSIERSTIFVQGDPEQVIAGANLNPTSFLTTSNIDMLKDFEASSIFTFAERSQFIKDESGNIENGNEAAEENELLKEGPSFELRKSYNHYYFESAKEKLTLRFSIKNGNKVEFDQISSGDFDFPVKVLHYSMKNNQEAFSILVMIEDNTGKNLISLTFVKKKAQNLSMGSTYYKYLAGPGVKARWNKNETLKIRLCSPPTLSLASKYRNAINLWSSSLQNLLKYEVETVSTFPPFSDMNFHCIYNVSSYLTVSLEEDRANPAATIAQIDRFTGEIIDSDILVFNSEIEKFASSQSLYNDIGWVIAHEMGHFLGLHHQFDDSVASIMSYDRVDYVTTYDYNAIRALYQ